MSHLIDSFLNVYMPVYRSCSTDVEVSQAAQFVTTPTSFTPCPICSTMGRGRSSIYILSTNYSPLQRLGATLLPRWVPRWVPRRGQYLK